jgi:hypothetical protein
MAGLELLRLKQRRGLLDLHPIKARDQSCLIADGLDRAISGDSRQRVPSRVRQVAFILQLVAKPGLRREGDVNVRARASCAERENRDQREEICVALRSG